MLARYIFDKDQFAEGRVRYSAFIPPLTNPNVSVYEIEGCDEAAAWALGVTYVASLRGKEILARGDVENVDVYALQLTIAELQEPHPRHRDIGGWPAERPKQKLLAAKLAEKTGLVIKSV